MSTDKPSQGITLEEIEACAKAEAEFDGRPWQSMGRADRERYTERAKVGLTAARAGMAGGAQPLPADIPSVLVETACKAYLLAPEPYDERFNWSEEERAFHKQQREIYAARDWQNIAKPMRYALAAVFPAQPLPAPGVVEELTDGERIAHEHGVRVGLILGRDEAARISEEATELAPGWTVEAVAKKIVARMVAARYPVETTNKSDHKPDHIPFDHWAPIDIRNAAAALVGGWHSKGALVRLVIEVWLSALAAARKPLPASLSGGWRDIESAPKDGTRVLLSEDGETFSGAYEAKVYRPGWYATYNTPDCDYPQPDKPTHWMPQPAPPGATEQAPIGGWRDGAKATHVAMPRADSVEARGLELTLTYHTEADLREAGRAMAMAICNAPTPMLTASRTKGTSDDRP